MSMEIQRVRVLGPLRIDLAGNEVELPKSKKARALFAYLAVAGRAVSKEQLATMFFGQTGDPRGGLRWCLSRLRGALGKDGLLTDGDTARLAPDAFWVDALALAEHAKAGRPIEDGDFAESAGDFLSDLVLDDVPEYEAWRLTQQVHYRNVRIDLLSRSVEQNLGDQSGIDAARDLVGLDASKELSWALLIRALRAGGEVAEARRVQRLAVDQLEREGVALGGDLAASWRSSDASRTRSKKKRRGSMPSLRPRVAVLPTRVEGAASALAGELGDAVYRAASTCKLMAVVAPFLSNSILDGEGSLLERARAEGIEFMLQPAVTASGGGLQVTAELLDSRAGACLFTWRRMIAEPGRVAPEVEAQLAARFEIDFQIVMIGRTFGKPEAERSALDLYLTALPRVFSSEGFDPYAAHELLEQSLSENPYFGLSSAMLAMVRSFMPEYNNNDKALARTLQLARRGVELGQDDAYALGICAILIGHSDCETGLDLARRALTLNPHSLMSGIAAAILSHYSGDDAACLEHVGRLEANADTDPLTFFVYTAKAMAHYQQRDYEEALRWARRAVGHNPRYVVALRYELASLGQLGRDAEAAQLLKQVVGMDSSENLAFFRARSAYVDEDRLEHLCAGLAAAGMT